MTTGIVLGLAISAALVALAALQLVWIGCAKRRGTET